MRLPVVVSIASVIASTTHAENPVQMPMRDGVQVQYTRPIIEDAHGEDDPRADWVRYEEVTIRSRSGVLHRLSARPESGPFDGLASPELSPDAAFVVLGTLDGGYASEGTSRSWHDVPGCVFVATDTAQVVGVGSRGECVGEFTSASVWRTIDGYVRDLAEEGT